MIETDNINGLCNNDVKNNRLKYGSNELTSDKKNSFLTLFWESLSDPIIKILLIVLAVKTVFLFQNFDWFETLGIVIAILLASLISIISEYGSEKAFKKLQEEASLTQNRVKRNKEVIEIFTKDIVVGDIVLLSQGDIVPADAVIVKGDISLDESSFTGETKDVEKTINNEVYKGSVVLNGNAIIKVTKVGLNTKYGKIALELLNKNPDSPLKLKLKNLANIISKIGYTGAILVMISYLFSVIFISNSFDMQAIKQIFESPNIIFGYLIYALTLGVTIIIVSVPEGLPMMIALVLSSNMKRMIKENVLVRRMVGIETAGCMNTLFSDKTGTITKGNLEVVEINLLNDKKITNISSLSKYNVKQKLILQNLYFNNEAAFDNKNNIIGGNITDKAILKFTTNLQLDGKVNERETFNSTNKYSKVTIQNGNKETILIKGAPDILLKNINETYNSKGQKETVIKELIQKEINTYTSSGYRVLMLAEKPFKYSDNLTFLGLVILKDEINDTAKEAISSIKKAGVHFIMITGDAKDTAINIGKETGIVNNSNDLVLTSKEIKCMSDKQLREVFNNIKIIARAEPSDKSRLVKIGQSLNQIIGMTGDGVNDAPALKCADVGFAMGKGSEVAKEASDIVILDNNLLSISKAILYGRTIFKSIRKFIIFQLTMNLCALTLSILGPFLNIDTPVTVMQMLWINMIMDTLAGLAFSFEPPIKEYLNENPKNKNEKIINKYMYSSIIFTGIYTSILLILFLKLPILNSLFRYDENNIYLMTAFFGLFVFSGVFNAFNARTQRLNILSNITKNIPFIFIIGFILIVQIILLYQGGSVFRTFGLNIKEFIIMFLLSFSVIPFDMLRKRIYKNNNNNYGV